jgi:hypothetical protein
MSRFDGTERQEIADIIRRHSFGAQTAKASANVTCPYGSTSDVTGCTLTLPTAGTFLVWAVGDLDCVGDASGDNQGVVQLMVDGVAESNKIIVNVGASEIARATAAQVYLITTTAASIVIHLECYKISNYSTITAKQYHTTLTALRVG